jgi:hypothetical protein
MTRVLKIVSRPPWINQEPMFTPGPMGSTGPSDMIQNMKSKY